MTALIALEKQVRAMRSTDEFIHRITSGAPIVANAWKNKEKRLELLNELKTVRKLVDEHSPFYVSRNISEMLLDASQDLPGTYRPDIMDNPAQGGAFIWLEQPIPADSAFPATYGIGSHFVFFGGNALKGRSPLQMVITEWDAKGLYTSGDFWDPAEYPLSSVPITEWEGQDTSAQDSAQISARGVTLRRFVCAFMLFIKQKILVASTPQLSRPERRRAARENLDISLVKVITLRATESRHKPANGEHDSPDWQFRWMVRGHWRNQWYPTEKRHIPIWILPHIKGPEGKPVREAARVFAVTR